MFNFGAKVEKFPVYFYQKNEKNQKRFVTFSPKIIYYFK